MREPTFLYHSLQNIHVVLLRHAAERGELGLGDKLQELEEREEVMKKTTSISSRQRRRLSVLLPGYFMSVMLRSLKGARQNKCCLDPVHLLITLK